MREGKQFRLGYVYARAGGGGGGKIEFGLHPFI